MQSNKSPKRKPPQKGKAEPKSLTFNCLTAKQAGKTLALFTISGKALWKLVAINQRDPDKQKGYQRVLKLNRVGSISRYIEQGNVIPNSILVSFDDATISDDGTKITIPNKP